LFDISSEYWNNRNDYIFLNDAAASLNVSQAHLKTRVEALGLPLFHIRQKRRVYIRADHLEANRERLRASEAKPIKPSVLRARRVRGLNNQVEAEGWESQPDPTVDYFLPLVDYS